MNTLHWFWRFFGSLLGVQPVGLYPHRRLQGIQMRDSEPRGSGARGPRKLSNRMEVIREKRFFPYTGTENKDPPAGGAGKTRTKAIQFRKGRKHTMSTPHNAAQMGDFAKTVLMPGDPLRAKFIAETFLEDARLVNNVRGIHGYTGTYKGTPVSVMASGMGMPSIGIYSYELYSQYGVENIMRIGSAGAISDKLKLRDVVAAQGACTNSNFARQYGLPGTFAPIADFKLLETAVAVAREMGVEMPVGNLLSSDTFYDASASTMQWAKMGVLAVEMEAAALYMTAAHLGKRALAICSISDSIVTGEELSAEERQTTFTTMMTIALETARKMDEKRLGTN